MATSKKIKIPIIVLGALLILLLIARIVAPIILENIINNTLKNAQTITGSVKDIDLHLYRGGYEIEGLSVISKDTGQPLFEVEEIDISLFWKVLLSGRVVAEIDVIKPSVYLFDSAKDQEKEKYKTISDDKAWFSLFDATVPIAIDRIRFIDGRGEFNAKRDKLDAEFFISDFQAEITNITGRNANGDVDTSTVKMTALAYDVSEVTITGEADVRATKPTFNFDVSAKKIALEHFDKIIRVYAPFDIEGGALDFASEIKSVDAKIDGYIKIGVFDLDIFSWRQDIEKDDDNIFQAFVDGLIGGVSAILENGKTDLVATKIPIKGQLSNPDVAVIDGVLGLLRNAFIQAYNMKVDEVLSFGTSNEDLASLSTLREYKTKNAQSDKNTNNNESENKSESLPSNNNDDESFIRQTKGF